MGIRFFCLFDTQMAGENYVTGVSRNMFYSLPAMKSLLGYRGRRQLVQWPGDWNGRYDITIR